MIEFAYSGNININKDNVQTLLEAADFWGIEFVKNSCGDFLKGGVNDKTCLVIWHLADVFSLEELSHAAKKHVLRHFSDVWKEEEFLCLPVRLLADLLSDEELCVVIEDLIPCVEEREKVVLQALFQYVEHDEENRKDLLPQLLPLVKLPTLSESYLDEISAHALLQNSCVEILEKAKKLKKDPPEKDSPDAQWVVPRTSGKYVMTWGRCFANSGQVQPEIARCVGKDTFEDFENVWFTRPCGPLFVPSPSPSADNTRSPFPTQSWPWNIFSPLHRR